MIIKNLDALRGLASIAVVFFHLNGQIPGVLPWISQFGWMGVDLFFVISGAVISATVSRSLSSQSQWKRNFIINRVARIYPLYIFTSCVYLALSYNHFSEEFDLTVQVLSHLLMVHTLHSTTFYGLNHVTWSLAIEFHFYLLIIIFASCLSNHKRYVLLIFSFFLISYFWNYFSRNEFHSNPDLMNLVVSQLPGRIDEFAQGVLVWKFWSLRRRFDSSLASSLFGGGAVIIASVVLYAWCAGVSGANTLFSDFGLWLHVMLGDTLVRMLIGACFGLMVLGLSLMRLGCLSYPLDYLGKTSYGIYLWHPIVMTYLISFELVATAYFIWVLLITSVLASISYHLLEVPGKVFVRNSFSGMNRQSVGAFKSDQKSEVVRAEK